MSTDVKTATPTSQDIGQRTAPNGVKLPIYMDNHATSPMDPRVLEEMLPYFMEKFGNSASRNHPFGWAAEEAVELSRERVVIFHTDAVQAIGKVPVDVNKMNIDVASITGHKLYGPKGAGALYVRRKNPRVQLVPLIDGGGHERGMRSGTLNVPGITGLGKACAIAQEEMPQESCKMAGLRNRLKDNIMSRLDEVYINGSMEHRLPGNLNISFAYVEGESLLMGINDIAVSSGSACTSATLEPSYVLKALGTGDDLAHSSIRFGIGRFNTEAEVDYVAGRMVEVVKKLRELSPLYEMVKEGIDLSKIVWQ